MGSYPLPALAVNQNQPSPLEQMGRVMQLKNMMQQSQQQQALMPGQLQEQQQNIQSGAMDLQMKKIALQNNQIRQTTLADPNFQKEFKDWQGSKSSDTSTPATPSATGAPTDSPVSLHPLAQFLAEKKGLPVFGPGGAMETSEALTKSAQSIAEFSKTQGEAGKLGLENSAKKYDNFDNIAEPVLAEKDPVKQAAAIQNFQSTISAHPELYPPEAIKNLGVMGTIQGLQTAANTSKMHQMLIDDATKTAQGKEAQQKADPVAQLSTPEALMAPGAQAAIQAKISDPATNPADVPRLQALLPKSAVAQKQQIVQKAREAAATQAVTQGDPNAAGQLLASRTLTIDEMKLRGMTPQFQQQAILAAQKIDPTFKAPEAAAQGRIAGSQANQQFFGNTDSLLVKGGTLDQLEARGAALGTTKIPAYNSLQNWTKAALGSGPQAAYAASVLGVADDYSKVMTGGQGSDTSRQQALDIISKNLSPEGRAAAVQQIREQVDSQRSGRIGTNPYMKDMYPHPGGENTAQSAPAQHVPGGKAQGLAEGATGKGSDGKPYVVKGGVWVPQ